MLWLPSTSTVDVHVVENKDRVPTLLWTNRTINIEHAIKWPASTLINTYKVEKERKFDTKNMTNPYIVDPGSVLILGHFNCKVSEIVGQGSSGFPWQQEIYTLKGQEEIYPLLKPALKKTWRHWTINSLRGYLAWKHLYWLRPFNFFYQPFSSTPVNLPSRSCSITGEAAADWWFVSPTGPASITESEQPSIIEKILPITSAAVQLL